MTSLRYNSNNTITIIDVLNYFSLLICLLIVLFFILILPIIEIYFGTHYYYNNIDCVSIIKIPLSIWLIVKGSVTIMNIFNVCIYFIVINNDIGKLLSLYLMFLINIFSFIWIILGSIIFWRDCVSCKPDDLNILMYFSLIIGYVNILSGFSQNNYILNNSNKKKKPLLEI
jgi:hypothetical protein